TDKVRESPRRYEEGLGMMGGMLHPDEAFRPDHGFWSLHAGAEYLRDALACLPANAEISFEVYLDAGSCESLMRANVHHDRLVLHATWKSGQKTVHRAFMVDASSGLHNSARFGSPR